MKCLSIKQPWAWAIVAGHKDIENRTWPTSYRGPVLIHAGKTDSFDLSDDDLAGAFEGMNDVTLPEHMDRGGIIGIAEIVDCVDCHESPWFDGPYGFVLANARPLPFTPLRGQLGLFEVQLEVTP